MSKFLKFIHKKYILFISKFYKFKKYIIKYEIIKDKIKVIESSGKEKYVENNFYNRVKLEETIKEHKEEINLKISYYSNKEDEYEIILFINAFVLIVLGFIFIFSFFIGDITFFLLTLTIISLYLLIFINFLSRIVIFREEVNRLKEIINDCKNKENN